MKRNLYITLTILCILFMVLIQNAAAPLEKQNNIESNSIQNKLSIESYDPLFIALSLVYFLMFFWGIINLSIFLIRKIRGLNLIETKVKKRKLNLSAEKSSQLLFFIIALSLIGYLSTIIICSLKICGRITNLTLFINMILQLSTILIIINHIKLKKLGSNFDKNQLAFTFRFYTATLPILFIALILNNLLAKTFDLRNSLGPAVELFFSLDNKTSLLILIFQIVILGPIAEELFFRGFLYKLARNRYSIFISAALISLIFSLVHKTPINILGLFVLSFALCYLYEKTQSIISPVIFHATHNLVSLSFLLLIKKGL